MTTAIEAYEQKKSAVEDLRALLHLKGTPLTVVARELDLDVRSIENWLEGRHFPAGKKLERLLRYLKRKKKAR